MGVLPVADGWGVEPGPCGHLVFETSVGTISHRTTQDVCDRRALFGRGRDYELDEVVRNMTS